MQLLYFANHNDNKHAFATTNFFKANMLYSLQICYMVYRGLWRHFYLNFQSIAMNFLLGWNLMNLAQFLWKLVHRETLLLEIALFGGRGVAAEECCGSEAFSQSETLPAHCFTLCSPVRSCCKLKQNILNTDTQYDLSKIPVLYGRRTFWEILSHTKCSAKIFMPIP